MPSKSREHRGSMYVEGTGRLWEVGNIYYRNKRHMSFADS